MEESSEALGKTAGKDAQQHKITFPAVYGLENSHAMAESECDRRAPRCWSRSASARSGCSELADLIVQRKSMKTPDEDRLDRLLVERGLAESREKAQALIMAGTGADGWAEGGQSRARRWR